MQLRGTDQEPALKLLELFAYGTYDDWKGVCGTWMSAHYAVLDRISLSHTAPLRSGRTSTKTQWCAATEAEATDYCHDGIF